MRRNGNPGGRVSEPLATPCASGSRQRLDITLLERGLVSSREQARALIMAGEVLINGVIVDKPGTAVSTAAEVKVIATINPYVSRGGVKLKGALQALSLSVHGAACLDVGASTGGFTDCLLSEGAAKVHALDVGYGQLAWKLRNDARVVVIERTNIRHYDGAEINIPVDLVTIDVSFISLKIVIPAVLPFVKPGGFVLALIKPQFEAGRREVGKGGVVRDPSVHDQVIAGISEFICDLGLDLAGSCESVITGPSGNREFFILARIPVVSLVCPTSSSVGDR